MKNFQSSLYYKINPDLESSSKILNYNCIISQQEKGLAFGELQVYNTLVIKGSFEVHAGRLYYNVLVNGLNSQTLYGPMSVVDEIIINGTINII
jgi:hypothetical protein